MLTAEFEAKIVNGKIVIPEEYKSAFEKQETVKVILVKPDEPVPVTDSEDIIQQLLNHPLSITDFVPNTRDNFYDR